jgi:hypothetical protein
LESLIVSHNSISSLPPGFGPQRLRNLDLSHNPIREEGLRRLGDKFGEFCQFLLVFAKFGFKPMAGKRDVHNSLADYY